MGAAAAVIIRKEKDLVAIFQRARATSAASARSLGDLQIEDDHTLRRLKNRAIIREGAPDMLYLDEPGWEARGRMRRRMALVILVIVAAIGLGIALTGRNVLSP